MAHDGSPVVVSGGLIINRFRAFLERLSLEIQEDQLEGLKFLLEGNIPLGILEKCQTPRQLFSRMIQQSLLGEDNLDNLEQLFKEVKRSDLVERVRVFKQSYMEVDCALPVAMEVVCFSIGAQRTDLNVKDTEGKLMPTMCAALNIDPSEIHRVGSEGVGGNWFNLTFEIPKRKEVLDTLRWAAIEKKSWLGLCGVKAVTIGNESQILMQPVTRSVSLTAGTSHNGKNLDLILVVDCATSNPALLGHLKSQLSHLVSVIFNKGFHLRLALISYQNHPKTSRFGMRSNNPHINNTVYTQNFTDDKQEMKDLIKNLRCFGKGGTTKGLADGLAAALTLSEADVDNNNSKCRKDAIKMCILLPMVDRRATLEIFKCEHGHDVMKLCRQLSGNSVTLYTVAVAALSKPVPSYLPDPALALMADFFAGISHSTGGQFIQIQNIKLISEVVMYAIDEGVSMENLFGTAYDIIFEKVKKTDHGDVDLEDLTNVLEGALNQRFCRVSLILLDRLIIGPKSKLAKMFSFDETIDSACTTFQCALEKLRRTNIVTAPGTPSDVDMEVEEMVTHSPQISLSTNHEITTDVSERMVRKVGLRKHHYWPR
ncbi:hypothetical protein ACROYT_G037382 [Oculina patagonica]